MDIHTLVTTDSINNLKCFICNNYLSYFPITIGPNNQSSCGRCLRPEGTVFQNIAFETVAQFMKFPCRYNSVGCSEKIVPKEVPQHEKDCPFRVIPCPTVKSTKCNWEGPRPTLLQHCQSDHSDMLLKNDEFEIDLSQSTESDAILEHNNTLLMMTRKFDHNNKVLYWAVYNYEYEINMKSYFCEIRVKNGNRTLLVNFKSSSFEEMDFTELHLTDLLANINKESILVKVSVEKAPEANVQVTRENVNLEMLSILKCLTCPKFVRPPIDACLKCCAVLCSKCKSKHTCLPVGNVIPSINSNLDRMATLLNYPCKYHHRGCTFFSKPGQIKIHEPVCEFSQYKCPVPVIFKNKIKDGRVAKKKHCQWRGPREHLFDHIQTIHKLFH